MKRIYISIILWFLASTIISAQDIKTDEPIGNATQYVLQRADRSSLKYDQTTEAYKQWHLGVTVGLEGILIGQRLNLKNTIGPSSRLFLGKWLTPTSGIELGLMASLMDNGGNRSNSQLLLAGADIGYSLNLTNLISRKPFANKFNLFMLTGPSLRMTQRADLALGWYGTMRGLYSTNSTISLMLEGRFGGYVRQSSTEVFMGSYRIFSTASLSAGIVVRINNSYKNAYKIREDYKYSVLIGATLIPSKNFSLSTTGASMRVAAERAISPVSAYRLSIGTDQYIFGKDRISLHNYSLGADYLMSLLPESGDEKKLFNCSALFGVGVGLSTQKGKTGFVPSAKAGIRGDFNLDDKLTLYIEPDLYVHSFNYTLIRNTSKLRPVLGLYAGASYKF